MEAAEEVCAEPRALEYLSQLQSHSLVVAEDVSEAMRFSLLESLRDYGAEKLEEEEGTALACRHSGFFLYLAETAAPQLRGSTQSA